MALGIGENSLDLLDDSPNDFVYRKDPISVLQTVVSPEYTVQLRKFTNLNAKHCTHLVFKELAISMKDERT